MDTHRERFMLGYMRLNASYASDTLQRVVLCDQTYRLMCCSETGIAVGWQHQGPSSPMLSTSTQPIPCSVQYIRRLLDHLRRCVPVFPLYRVFCEREDCGLERVVDIRCKDGMFELFATGKLDTY